MIETAANESYGSLRDALKSHKHTIYDEVGAALGVDKSTISRHIKAMVATDYMTREEINKCFRVAKGY